MLSKETFQDQHHWVLIYNFYLPGPDCNCDSRGTVPNAQCDPNTKQCQCKVSGRLSNHGELTHV
jgi:hypothetical protein